MSKWSEVIKKCGILIPFNKQKGEIKIKVINVSYYKYEFNLVELLLNKN
jgi:hypothetical protein